MFISNKKKSSKAITLAETLISAAIIILISTGVIALFMQVVSMSRKINYEYIATHIAKSRIERARSIIKSGGFGNLPELEEDSVIVDSAGVPDPDGSFIRDTDIEENYTGDSRLTRIEVNVWYVFKGKKSKNPIVMTTIFNDIE